MEESVHRYSEESRVAALDGIRGIAIIFVLLFHIAPGGTSVLSGGFLGVDLFFVLSGFLITSILLAEEQRFGTISLKRFYLRRALRLLPALFFLLAVVSLYSTFRLPEEIAVKVNRGIISSLFYYSNWILAYERAALHMLNHTWSLSIEEQFYICFPFLLTSYFRWSSDRRFLALLLVFLSVVSALLMSHYYSGPEQTNLPYSRTDSHMAPILLGAAFAVSKGWRPSLVGPVLAWLALVVVLVFSYFADFRSEYMYKGGFFLFALCAAALVDYAGSQEKGILRRWFSFYPFCWCGKLSYGLYLWHFPVFVAISVEYPGPQGWYHFLPGIVISLLCAQLSFVYIERPCLKLKERFSSIHLK